MRRGYKAWCERIAEQYRAKLGIEKSAPLCPWKLSAHLNVIVWNVDDIPDIAQNDIDLLTGPAQDSWSAATLFHADKSLVILNSAHSKARLANDLMHELSHIICGHKPIRVDISEDELMMLQSYDDTQEEEADLLAAILLLPRVALVSIKAKGISTKQAANDYGVSEKLMTMRLNTAGVNKQFKNKNR